MNKICEILENVSLKNYNTYRIDTMTKYLACPKTIEELIKLISYLNANKLKYCLLGNGSNVIIGDKKYNGVIISLLNLNEIEIDNNGIMSALTGAFLPKMCMKAIAKGFKGLEWASGIPGTIGGSVIGNAGAYLSCIFDYLLDIDILENDKIKTLTKDEIKYDYRYTSLKENKNIIVLRVRLQLKKGNKEESISLIEDRKLRRLNSQPLNYPSAGSVFRNPSKDMPAGKLIEDCGLKGRQIGGAQISKLHANFIINVGNATSQDIVSLINLIKKEVKKKYDIDLICEQEILKWE